MTFFEKFLRHEVEVDEFMDAVDAWHDDPNGGSDVSKYLGMTKEQYGLFLTKPHEAEKLRSAKPPKFEKTGSFLAKVIARKELD